MLHGGLFELLPVLQCLCHAWVSVHCRESRHKSECIPATQHMGQHSTCKILGSNRIGVDQVRTGMQRGGERVVRDASANSESI